MLTLKEPSVRTGAHICNNATWKAGMIGRDTWQRGRKGVCARRWFSAISKVSISEVCSRCESTSPSTRVFFAIGWLVRRMRVAATGFSRVLDATLVDDRLRGVSARSSSRVVRPRIAFLTDHYLVAETTSTGGHSRQLSLPSRYPLPARAGPLAYQQARDGSQRFRIRCGLE